MKVKAAQSCPTLLWPRGLYSPWNSPGQNTGVSSLSLLQGIFPTQGPNPGLPHYGAILYQLRHKGNPYYIGSHSAQFSRSVVSDSATPWTAACQPSLSITNSRSPPKPMSIESMMPPNHLILCRPLLLLPSVLPSIRVFSNKSALHIRWPNYWNFSLNISPSNEHPGLISFRMDRLDFLPVQRTLKSLLQHHSSKASILWHSVFFIVQLSHPYMTTGKTIALTIWTFVGKVMSLSFNILSKLVIAFLPRSKRLLISWLQSPSEVILEPKKIKSVTVDSVTFCHQSEWPSSKFVQTISAVEHMEKMETLLYCWWECNLIAIMENSRDIP